jgi:hypothetical protein
MKKVLVAFAVVALFASCNDNANTTEPAKTDSAQNATTPAPTTGTDSTKGGDSTKPAATPAPADSVKKDSAKKA